MEIDELKQKLEEAEKVIQKLKKQNNEVVTFDEQLFQVKENIRGLHEEEFLAKILQELCKHTGLDFIFIAKLDENKEHFKTIKAVYKGELVENFEYSIIDTPCENTYSGAESLIFEDNVQSLFPNDKLLKEYKIEGFIGLSLFNSNKDLFGILVGLSESKIDDSEKKLALMQFFEERISTEIDSIYKTNELNTLFNNFTNLLSNIDAIVIFLDLNGNLIYCNNYFLKLTGYTLDEILNTNWFEKFITEERKNEILKVFYNSIKGERFPDKYENEIILKNGELKLIKWINTVLKDENGKILMSASIGEDITKIKRIEQELKYSESRYKALSDATTEGVVISKLGVIIDVNNRAYEITGYSRDELIGHSIIEFVDDEFKEIVKSNIENNIELAYEIYILRKDGSKFPAIVNTRIVEYLGDNVRLTLFRDISLRYQAIQNLKQSEENYRNLINNAPMGIAVHHKGELLFVNDTAIKLLEYDNPEEVLGKNVLDFIYPDYRDLVLERMKVIISEKKVAPIINEVFIRKNKEPLTVEINAIPITYDGKESIMVMFHDISYRIESEKKIRESQLKYQTIFDNAPEAIFLMDNDIFIDCNEKTLEMFGCKKEDIIGKPPYVFSPEYQYDGQESKTKALYYINKAISGEPQSFEWLHKKLNGELIDAFVSLNVVEINNRKFLQAIVRDITIEKKQQQEIKKLAKIIETTPQLVVITNLEGSIEYINHSYIENSSYTDEELMGSKIYNYTTEIYSQKIKNEVIPELLSYGYWKGEIDLVRKDGSIINTNFVCSVINDEKRHPIYFVAVITDITQIKEAQKALKESKENLRITLNSIGDAVIATDLNGLITGMNPVAESLTGWKEKESISRYIDDVLNLKNSVTDKPIKTPVQEVIDKNKKVGLANHTKLISKSGEEFHIADSAAPIRDDNGKIVGVVLVFRDVTKEYNLREKLKKNEDRLSKIMLAANDGMWDWNLITNEVYYDPRYYTMAGYEVNEFPGHVDEFTKRLHPEERDRIIQLNYDHIEGRTERYFAEFRFLTKSGQYMWILSRGSIVERDESGKPTRFVGTHTDITERKLIEEKLKISEQKFRSLFENMKLGLVLHKIVVDENNKLIDSILLDMNEAYTELTGISRDAIGKRVTDILPQIKIDSAYWIEHYGNVAITGQSITFEHYAKTLKKWFRVTAYQSGEGQFATIFDNITKQKELELQLQTLNEVLEERIKERTSQLEDAMKELLVENSKRKQIQEDLLRYQKELRKALKKEQELNMMKSAFISMVSHQYRTPLTVIQTSTDLIPKYFQTGNFEKLNHHIERINISIDKMTEMLEKIMMIGKFDISQDNLELEKFNINELILIEIEKIKDYDKYNHPINFDYSSEEIKIQSNRFIIEQIINNLLSNAVKYSEKDKEIKVTVVEEQNYVKLMIEDRGIGILESDLEKIFDDFYRGGNVENIYGTGLGLSIVKRFCEKIEALINVESQIGEGTKFIIRIPKISKF